MAKAAVSAPNTGDQFLPYQRVLIAHKEAGHSLRALGETAGVNDSMLSRATTQPGRELDIETLKRLVPHVEGLREALAQQWAEKLALDAADLGIDLPTATADDRALVGAIMVRPDEIDPSPYNPRKLFGEEELEELADSIEEVGVLQNLSGRRKPDGRIELMAGERRWRAGNLLVKRGSRAKDDAFLPIVIKELTDGQARAIALLENLQRVQVSALEEAAAFRDLQNLDPEEWTVQAIAKAIGKNSENGHRYVLQRLALVNKLNMEAQDLLENGTITFEKARFLTQFGPAAQDAIIIEIERGDADLLGLFDGFRRRAQAIADAIAPKPAREKKSAEAGKGQADSEARNADPATDRSATQYRATIVPGATPATAQVSAGLADIAPELLALGLPDPSTWELKTSTEALLTITLQAPSQDAFDATLQLFAAAQGGAKDKAA